MAVIGGTRDVSVAIRSVSLVEASFHSNSYPWQPGIWQMFSLGRVGLSFTVFFWSVMTHPSFQFEHWPSCVYHFITDPGYTSVYLNGLPVTRLLVLLSCLFWSWIDLTNQWQFPTKRWDCITLMKGKTGISVVANLSGQYRHKYSLTLLAQLVCEAAQTSRHR